MFTYDFDGVRITGVYEDNLVFDDKFYENSAEKPTWDYEKSKEWSSLMAKASDKLDNNFLSHTILMPTAVEKFYHDTAYEKGVYDIKFLHGEYIDLSYWNNERKQTVSLANFIAATSETSRFTSIDFVNKGEIVVSEMYARNNGINDGDIIEIKSQLIEGEKYGLSSQYNLIKEIIVKKFTVKINSQLKGNFAVFNEDEYNELTDNFKREMSRIFFSAKAFKCSDINNITHIANKVFGKNYEYLGFDAFLNYNGDYLRDTAEFYSFMDMIRKYVFVAIDIVLMLIYFIFGYNVVSTLISGKANDLLILKSLGANQKDYFKIYGIFSVVQILFEIAMGVLFGIGAVYLMNYIMTSKLTKTFTVMLPVVPLAIILVVLAVILVNILALTVNIFKINDKNLRKAFQKIKD